MITSRFLVYRASFRGAVAAALAALLLPGCADWVRSQRPAPETRAREVARSPQVVWETVLDQLTHAGYSFAQLDREGGVLITDWLTDMSLAAGIGWGPDGRPQKKISVVVTSVAEERSRVGVQITARIDRISSADIYLPVQAPFYDAFFADLEKRLGAPLLPAAP